MNIFVTSKCPIISATYLDDKRCIKMITESCQMLCTALSIKNGNYKKIKVLSDKAKPVFHHYIGDYRIMAPTHSNHPANIWARESLSNWLWLRDHALALCNEYTKRFGKVHACEDRIKNIIKFADCIEDKSLTPFANCTPYKDMDVFEAYVKTLNNKWASDKRPPRWFRKEKLPSIFPKVI